MNKLNKKVEYALMALACMKSKPTGQLTTAKEVVKATGVPFDATARVMQIMSQKGVLKSEQGAQGGYSIIKNLQQVSFYDLTVMILGPLGVAKCLHGSNHCEAFESCNILKPIHFLNDRLIEFYKGISIDELLNAENEGSKLMTLGTQPTVPLE